MDKNRTDGITREIKGTVKELIGQLTGNKSKELAGAAEKHLGQAQANLGEAKDEMKDLLKKDD